MKTKVVQVLRSQGMDAMSVALCVQKASQFNAVMAFCPDQQRCTQLILQTLDSGADRRLGNKKLVRRSSNVPAGDDSQKGFNLLVCHGACPFL